MPHNLKNAVWQKAYPIHNINPDLMRRDIYGNPIAFCEYGHSSKYGWEIDHIIPKSIGGNNHIKNLQPLHWRANRMKGNSLTY